MPRRYAASNHAGDNAPPAASNPSAPSAAVSAASSGGNSGAPCGSSQTSAPIAPPPARIPVVVRKPAHSVGLPCPRNAARIIAAHHKKSASNGRQNTAIPFRLRPMRTKTKFRPDRRNCGHPARLRPSRTDLPQGEPRGEPGDVLPLPLGTSARTQPLPPSPPAAATPPSKRDACFWLPPRGSCRRSRLREGRGRCVAREAGG